MLIPAADVTVQAFVRVDLQWQVRARAGTGRWLDLHLAVGEGVGGRNILAIDVQEYRAVGVECDGPVASGRSAGSR